MVLYILITLSFPFLLLVAWNYSKYLLLTFISFSQPGNPPSGRRLTPSGYDPVRNFSFYFSKKEQKDHLRRMDILHIP